MYTLLKIITIFIEAKYLLENFVCILLELFMQQAFQQVGLAQDSPLYVVMKTGFQSLPALMR